MLWDQLQICLESVKLKLHKNIGCRFFFFQGQYKRWYSWIWLKFEGHSEGLVQLAFFFVKRFCSVHAPLFDFCGWYGIVELKLNQLYRKSWPETSRAIKCRPGWDKGEGKATLIVQAICPFNATISQSLGCLPVRFHLLFEIFFNKRHQGLYLESLGCVGCAWP